MGVLIPLFQRKETEDELQLGHDQRVRLKLLENTMMALRKEEEAIENAISQKCNTEIERLRAIGMKLRQLEMETEGIKKTARAHAGLS